jgi:hypothetical protein
MEIPELGDIVGAIVGAIAISLLIFIVLFLLLREVVCWYLKINKQLSETERMNQTLLEIRALLIQGNMVGAITAGQVSDMAQTTAASPAAGVGSVYDDIPDL